MSIAAHSPSVHRHGPMFMRVARDGGAGDFSESWHEFTGLTRAQCAADGWLVAVHRDDRSSLRQECAAAFAGGTARCAPVRLLEMESGRHRRFGLHLAPCADPAGGIAFVHAVLMPVADAAASDAGEALASGQGALAASRSLRLVADALPQIVWSAQGSGWHDYFNERWYEYTGMPRGGAMPESQARLQTWIEHVHPDDRAAVQGAWRHALATAQPYAVELRCRRRDGTHRWFLARARPLRAGGRVLRWFGTYTDIEDQKQAQLERERLLASERRARSGAERAQRLTEEFVALVSHELRAPLSAVLNWAQLAQRAADQPDAVRSAAESIERSARLQAQLVDDLFDAGRIVFGKMDLQLEPLAIEELLEASLATVRHAALAKRIRLSLEVSDPMRIEGDSRRLQQVLVNLLTNAVKFTPEGGAVSVHASHQGGHAVIEVADTGCGIATHVLPFVFERFRQADEAQPGRRAGGLGLGLHIVRSLVELHGGTVEADSAGLGRGAAFTVRLPAPAAERAQPPWPAEAQALR